MTETSTTGPAPAETIALPIGIPTASPFQVLTEEAGYPQLFRDPATGREMAAVDVYLRIYWHTDGYLSVDAVDAELYAQDGGWESYAPQDDHLGGPAREYVIRVLMPAPPAPETRTIDAVAIVPPTVDAPVVAVPVADAVPAAAEPATP